MYSYGSTGCNYERIGRDFLIKVVRDRAILSYNLLRSIKVSSLMKRLQRRGKSLERSQ